MKLKSRSRLVLGLTALVAALQCSTAAMAQTSYPSMLGNVEPALRDRLFMRLDYIRANVKSTVGAVRDVTGPVLAKGDLTRLASGEGGIVVASGGTLSQYRLAANAMDGNPAGFTEAEIRGGLANDALDGLECEAVGLGSACNMRARGQAMIGTPAVSVGYFLGDEHTWAVEAFVLAKPIDVSITGDGPNQLNGKEIIKTKLLPPVVKFGRYFGAKEDKIRPYVGLLASYAIFFDSEATGSLNNYVGGSSQKDTTVNLKNAFGWGWMLGARADFGGDWHVALNIGKIRYKTEATITTSNTIITNDTPALNDYGLYAKDAIAVGNSGIAGGTTQIMCNVAKLKNGPDAGCNLGTFSRKSDNVLDNTLFVLSVGRSF